MARTFKITDGVDSVDFLSLSATAITAKRGGLGPTDHERDLSIIVGRGGDAHMAGQSVLPVYETYVFNLRSSGHDNAASQLQTLNELILKASDYYDPEEPWQNEPVWIEAQATNETNKRYALVLGSPHWRLPDLFKTPMEVDNRIEEIKLTIIREGLWRSDQPGTEASDRTIVHPDHPSGSGTIIAVPNANENPALVPLTHIYTYDAAPVTWSANQIASSSFGYFPTTPAAGDMCYFGGTGFSFHNICLNMTQNLVLAGYGFAWEYWNGAAWTDFNTLAFPQAFDDPSDGFRLYNGRSGEEFFIHWTGPTDWAKTTVNGVNAFWVRIRITSISGFTTNATQGSQVVYSATKPYIEIPNTLLDGDDKSILRIGMRSMNSDGLGYKGEQSYINRVTIGAKSRGLTNFNSRFLPSAAGIDTSIVTGDARGLDSRTGLTTFATQLDYVNIRLTASWIGGDAEDYRGRYRVKLGVNQVGGTTGQIDVGIKVNHSDSTDPALWESERKTLLNKDRGIPEIVELGTLEIPTGDFHDGLDELHITCHAESWNSTPNLEWYFLWLIPIDEWAVTLDDPMQPSGARVSRLDGAEYSNVRGHKKLWLDGGIIKPYPTATNTHLSQGASNEYGIANWQLRGIPPKIKAHKQTRLYFFYEYYWLEGTPPLYGDVHLLTAVNVQAHERWYDLRGSD